MGTKNQDVLFSENRFCSLLVWSYYALLLGYFGLKFLPDIRHCVYWVLTEVWAPNSSHKIGNKSFIRHCEGLKEGSFVWGCLIFFVGEYSSVLPEICRVLSQIKWRFLGWISGKNCSGKFFQKFYANHDYRVLKLVKFQFNFCNFILGPYCVEKKFTQALSYVVLHPRKEARL